MDLITCDCFCSLGNVHGSDSPGNSSRSGSPTTSPSSSISRGQANRLLDSSSTHFLYSHLETLSKQNETQRAILDELFAGMRLAGLRNAREASKQLDLYPAAPPSPAHPPTIPLLQHSTTASYEAMASAGVGSQRYVFVNSIARMEGMCHISIVVSYSCRSDEMEKQERWPVSQE